MKKANLILFCFLSIIACNEKENRTSFQEKSEIKDNVVIKQHYNIILDGILRINSDGLQTQRDTVTIFNEDLTVFGKIYSDSEYEEPTIRLEVSSKEIKISIRAYFPDYNIIFFDSYKPSNGIYEVLVNGDKKFIKIKEGITLFEEWETHLKSVFLLTNKENPLRDQPNEYSNLLLEYNYDEFNFEVVEIKDDWIKVHCNVNCEGCPSGVEVSGWLRWKKDNQLLLKLYYVC